jgi:hypothetical protein
MSIAIPGTVVVVVRFLAKYSQELASYPALAATGHNPHAEG